MSNDRVLMDAIKNSSTSDGNMVSRWFNSVVETSPSENSFVIPIEVDPSDPEKMYVYFGDIHLPGGLSGEIESIDTFRLKSDGVNVIFAGSLDALSSDTHAKNIGGQAIDKVLNAANMVTDVNEGYNESRIVAYDVYNSFVDANSNYVIKSEDLKDLRHTLEVYRKDLVKYVDVHEGQPGYELNQEMLKLRDSLDIAIGVEGLKVDIVEELNKVDEIKFDDKKYLVDKVNGLTDEPSVLSAELKQ